MPKAQKQIDNVPATVPGSNPKIDDVPGNPVKFDGLDPVENVTELNKDWLKNQLDGIVTEIDGLHDAVGSLFAKIEEIEKAMKA